MKNNKLRPLCMTIGLTLTGPALAVDIDFSGSDIYIVDTIK